MYIIISLTTPRKKYYFYPIVNSLLKNPLRFVGIIFMAMALFSLAGGHWAVLQSVAWANMIHNYSTQGSLSSAVEKTFSGKYRCSLCKKISEAKQQEKKNKAIIESIKKKDARLEQSSLQAILFAKKLLYLLPAKNNYCGPITRPPIEPPRLA